MKTPKGKRVVETTYFNVSPKHSASIGVILYEITMEDGSNAVVYERKISGYDIEYSYRLCTVDCSFEEFVAKHNLEF